MPKPHTPADRAFLRDLRAQLRALLDVPGARKRDIAAKLELSGQGLDDLVKRGRVPSMRTIALAVDRYGVRLRYKGTSCVVERRIEEASPDAAQLEFPFMLSAPEGNVTLRVGPTSDKSVTINVMLKHA